MLLPLDSRKPAPAVGLLSHPEGNGRNNTVFYAINNASFVVLLIKLSQINPPIGLPSRPDRFPNLLTPTNRFLQMTLNDLYAEMPRISEYLKEMRIPWTSIDEIAGMIERRYGCEVNKTAVRLLIQKSRRFRIAWAPGGAGLVASNCAHPSHFVQWSRNDLDTPEVA